jgi:hypothetical protein
MKVKLTIAQCMDIYDLPDIMAQAGLSVDWLTAIDMAYNKRRVADIVEGFRLAAKAPPKIREFEEKEGVARRTLRGQGLAAVLQTLNAQYANAVVAERLRQQQLIDDRDSRENAREVELIEIDKEKISGEGKLAGLVASALYPIFKRERQSGEHNG